MSVEEPRVAFVLGTRPEVVKLAPLIKECERRGVPFAVVHTGQHYSDRLDAVFFEQLELPAPDHHLGVGSGEHGEQTAAMLAGIEEWLRAESPELLFVQGDTNSTLAGALAASKLDVEVAHVEAGLRSFDEEMPEEVNRVLVDHAADHLFAPTPEAADLLEREGIDPDRIAVTGNTVVDAVLESRDLAAESSDVLDDLGLTAGSFYLLTVHRAENVDDPDRFRQLLDGVARVAARTDRPVVYPVHPRSAERIEEYGIEVPDAIRLTEPLEFFDFLRLEATAALALTDSGGVQEETCILGTPCVTLRYNTERPETAFVGANCVAGVDPDDVSEAADRMLDRPVDWTPPFGDGRAAVHIMNELGLGSPRPVEQTEVVAR
jgi:UDP-N-acetylglucosamine 2-epimerase (non-hydrolysing)